MTKNNCVVLTSIQKYFLSVKSSLHNHSIGKILEIRLLYSLAQIQETNNEGVDTATTYVFQ